MLCVCCDFSHNFTNPLVFILMKNLGLYSKLWKLCIYYFYLNLSMSEKTPSPGDGLRSVRTTSLFRAVNFELYTKPNAVVMGIGLVAIAGCAGYIAYMRTKYEGMGYYGALKEDGTEFFEKKKSKWD